MILLGNIMNQYVLYVRSIIILSYLCAGISFVHAADQQEQQQQQQKTFLKKAAALAGNFVEPFMPKSEEKLEQEKKEQQDQKRKRAYLDGINDLANEVQKYEGYFTKGSEIKIDNQNNIKSSESSILRSIQSLQQSLPAEYGRKTTLDLLSKVMPINNFRLLLTYQNGQYKSILETVFEELKGDIELVESESEQQSTMSSSMRILYPNIQKLEIFLAIVDEVSLAECAEKVAFIQNWSPEISQEQIIALQILSTYYDFAKGKKDILKKERSVLAEVLNNFGGALPKKEPLRPKRSDPTEFGYQVAGLGVINDYYISAFLKNGNGDLLNGFCNLEYNVFKNRLLTSYFFDWRNIVNKIDHICSVMRDNYLYDSYKMKNRVIEAAITKTEEEISQLVTFNPTISGNLSISALNVFNKILGTSLSNVKSPTPEDESSMSMSMLPTMFTNTISTPPITGSQASDPLQQSIIGDPVETKSGENASDFPAAVKSVIETQPADLPLNITQSYVDKLSEIQTQEVPFISASVGKKVSKVPQWLREAKSSIDQGFNDLNPAAQVSVVESQRNFFKNRIDMTERQTMLVYQMLAAYHDFKSSQGNLECQLDFTGARRVGHTYRSEAWKGVAQKELPREYQDLACESTSDIEFLEKVYEKGLSFELPDNPNVFAEQFVNTPFMGIFERLEKKYMEEQDWFRVDAYDLIGILYKWKFGKNSTFLSELVQAYYQFKENEAIEGSIEKFLYGDLANQFSTSHRSRQAKELPSEYAALARKSKTASEFIKQVYEQNLPLELPDRPSKSEFKDPITKTKTNATSVSIPVPTTSVTNQSSAATATTSITTIKDTQTPAGKKSGVSTGSVVKASSPAPQAATGWRSLFSTPVRWVSNAWSGIKSGFAYIRSLFGIGL